MPQAAVLRLAVSSAPSSESPLSITHVSWSGGSGRSGLCTPWPLCSLSGSDIGIGISICSGSGSGSGSGSDPDPCPGLSPNSSSGSNPGPGGPGSGAGSDALTPSVVGPLLPLQCLDGDATPADGEQSSNLHSAVTSDDRGDDGGTSGHARQSWWGCNIDCCDRSIRVWVRRPNE
jgi:hypothetical protein